MVRPLLLKDPGLRPLLILVTDGRGNVSLDGRPNSQATDEAIRVATKLGVDTRLSWVVIDTEDDRLVGKDGEVLDALQELSRLVVMTETGHRSRLTLDIAGFREKRRLELVALAKDAIAEVVESGEPVRLAPMNAYERKVIHDEVAGAGLTSESEGEPPLRRVVVSTS